MLNLSTHPSLVFDTQILETGIIKIPELQQWKNEEIHVIVVFKNAEKPKKHKPISMFGCLNKYAKPELIEQETELAWASIKD